MKLKKKLVEMKETPNNTQSGALLHPFHRKKKKKNHFLYLLSSTVTLFPLYLIPFIQLQDILKSHFLFSFPKEKKENVPYIIVGCYIPNTEILTYRELWTIKGDEVVLYPHRGANRCWVWKKKKRVKTQRERENFFF